MSGKSTCSLIESVQEETLSRIRRDRHGAPDGVSKLLEVVELRLWDSAFGAEHLRQEGSPDPDTLWSFQERFGCGVSAYIDQRRLETACRAVRETDAPISEIAMALGFQGPAHFTKWLKRRIGHAPSQLRATAQSAPAQSASEVSAPAQSAPEVSAPAQSAPAHSAPAQSAGSVSDTLVLTPVVGRQALVKVLEPLGVATLMRFLRRHYPDAFQHPAAWPDGQAPWPTQDPRQTRRCR